MPPGDVPDGFSMSARLAALTTPYDSGSNWFRVRDCGITFPPGRSGRGAKGPRSLVAMCTRVLADNIAAAPEASTRSLPERVKWALWKEVYPRSMALRTWHMLAPSLLDEAYLRPSSLLAGRGKGIDKDVTVPMAVCRSWPYTIDPTCPLSLYTTPLEHLGDCLIYLCIDDVARFESHELISLTTIPRLAVLELLERDSASSVVTDRLIRGWGEAGKHRQVFPSLRVLRISSGTHAVSEGSLHYVLRFPALEIFDTTALPEGRWRKASEIAHNYGWKVTEPNGSLFVSYARAYLDGLLEVNMRYSQSLCGVFTNDRQQVILVDDPRRLIYEDWKKKQLHDGPRDGPDLTSYLDDGWRALLQGGHPLSATTAFIQHARDMYEDRPNLTIDQAFLFLALLAQKEYNPACGIQAHTEGITLPREPFASLQLRSSSATEGQHPQPLASDHLVFSRQRVRTGKETSERVAAPRVALKVSHTDPPPSWAPRQDDRKVTNFKARKRQRTTADLLSSFGTPSGTQR